MANLFGVNLRGLFATAMGKQLYDATLTRMTFGAYSSIDPSAGSSPSTAVYPCKAVPTKVAYSFVTNEVTRAVSGEVLVLLGTLPVGISPGPGDVISIVNPKDGTTMVGTVTSADTDPAGVQSTCQVLA